LRADLGDRTFRDRLVRGTVRILTQREGGNLNAYLQPLDKGGNKVLVSSILRSAVDEDDTLERDWRQGLDLWLERMRDRARREA
jgi:hypothetical protein